jgi:hypothetical protein
MRWEGGHVAYIGEKRNACRDSVAINLKERGHLKALGLGKSIILS